MAHLIRKMRRIWAALFLPGVLDDAELMTLCRITASDLAAIRQEDEARHKPGTGAYWLDAKGRRQWVVRQAVPLVVNTLRGMR